MTSPANLPTVIRDQATSSAGRLLKAFFKGCLSQLRPGMLALLIWPFAIAVTLWGLSAWWFWDPLVLWLKESWLLSSRVVTFLSSWTTMIGWTDLGASLAKLVALLLMLPVVIATGMVAIALFAMPVVNRYLSAKHYPLVVRKGSFSLWANLGNAAFAVLVFTVGYLVSVPLWLVPPLALIVPWFWWSWLTARMMRFDSLVEHATPAEREALIRLHKREYFVLGLMVSALNYVPPLFLITPVLSALVFGHYSLSRLAQYRSAHPDSAKLPLDSYK